MHFFSSVVLSSVEMLAVILKEGMVLLAYYLYCLLCSEQQVGKFLSEIVTFPSSKATTTKLFAETVFFLIFKETEVVGP